MIYVVDSKDFSILCVLKEGKKVHSLPSMSMWPPQSGQDSWGMWAGDTACEEENM